MKFAIMVAGLGLLLAGCDDGDTHEEIIPLSLFHIPALVGVLLVGIAVVSVTRIAVRARG